MVVNGGSVIFDTCKRLHVRQQWEILKTEGDRNNIRICLRSYPEISEDSSCLAASSLIDPTSYKSHAQDFTIKPSNEARDILIFDYSQLDQSQHWLMNSTTHQLSSVKYPRACITTRHYKNPLLLECNGYGYESPNSKLPKHQSFHLMPALDNNGDQLCSDYFGLPIFGK